MNFDTPLVLAARHCYIWNERNQFERIPAIVEAYSKNIIVVDPDFTIAGWVKVGSRIGSLHDTYPDHVFTFSPLIESHHNIVRLTWQFGVPLQQAAITGWTLAVINNHCIQSLYTFHDH